MRNIIFNYQLGIQFTGLIFTVLGILSGNRATAQEIEQISEFDRHQGTAKDLEIVPELISEKTSTLKGMGNREWGIGNGE